MRARLCVSDLGPALEGDELRELFQPLSWLDGDGEGLGLMDLQMPELDGFETSRQLRATGFKGPIVALTASAEPETERQCLDAGMQVCLVKPLRLEQLTPVVTRLLEAGDAGVTGRRRSGSTPLPRPA